MADIELVIKIPNEMYQKVLDGTYYGTLYEELKHGVLIPKGHGRLGDLSKIYVELNEAQIEGTEEYKGLGKAKQIVCNAPTIIEADAEE